MEWLNYHHLLYFRTVVREGTIARAAQALRLAEPTVNGQVRTLERALGVPLLQRQGRTLVPTETGQVVYRYADEIFTLGRELLRTVEGKPGAGSAPRLRVGIADVLPKLVAFRLLEPAFSLDTPVHVVCRQDKPERLAAALAVHDLDLVLADAPVGAGTSVRVYSHQLGECGVVFCAAPGLAEKHPGRMPRRLDGAPFLMPAEGSALRRGLESWFAARGIAPRVLAEVEDSALLKVFGQAGHGFFAVPRVVADEARRRYGVRVVGATEDVRERFYAITAERRIRNPAVVAISETARTDLFG